MQGANGRCDMHAVNRLAVGAGEEAWRDDERGQRRLTNGLRLNRPLIDGPAAIADIVLELLAFGFQLADTLFATSVFFMFSIKLVFYLALLLLFAGELRFPVLPIQLFWLLNAGHAVPSPP